MPRPLVIISGTSGQHAAVVYEAATLSGRSVLGFVSHNDSSLPQVLDCRCLGGPEAMLDESLLRAASFVIACGSNPDRKEICDALVQREAVIDTIVHPQAIVSPSASIGEGTVILAGAIVATSTRIGRCCIINHSASVDHDCEVGDFVNICPGARLGGTVRVGDSVFAGLNSSVLQGLQIGAGSVLGAGAVVVSDVPAGVTVVGVPARPVSFACAKPTA